MEQNSIDFELPDDQALALAQLCKRIGFSDCRANAIDNDETYLMIDAIAQLQKALSKAGFNPR